MVRAEARKNGAENVARDLQCRGSDLLSARRMLRSWVQRTKLLHDGSGAGVCERGSLERACALCHAAHLEVPLNAAGETILLSQTATTVGGAGHSATRQAGVTVTISVVRRQGLARGQKFQPREDTSMATAGSTVGKHALR